MEQLYINKSQNVDCMKHSLTLTIVMLFNGFNSIITKCSKCSHIDPNESFSYSDISSYFRRRAS